MESIAKDFNDRVSAAVVEVIDAMANAAERYIFGDVLPADKQADRRQLYGTAHKIVERHLFPMVLSLASQRDAEHMELKSATNNNAALSLMIDDLRAELEQFRDYHQDYFRS